MKSVSWVQIKPTPKGVSIIGRMGKKAHLIPPLLVLLGVYLIRSSSTTGDLQYGLGLFSMVLALILGFGIYNIAYIEINRQENIVTTTQKIFNFIPFGSETIDLEDITRVALDYRRVRTRRNKRVNKYVLLFEGGSDQHPFMAGSPTELWKTCLRIRELLQIPINIMLAHPDKIIPTDQFVFDWPPEETVEVVPSQLEASVKEDGQNVMISYSDRSLGLILFVLFIFGPLLVGLFLDYDTMFVEEDTFVNIIMIALTILVVFFLLAGIIGALAPVYIYLTPEQISSGSLLLGLKIGSSVNVNGIIHLVVTDQIMGRHRIFILTDRKAMITSGFEEHKQSYKLKNLIENYYQKRM